MRILILTQWYPPEPATLMHEMAVELQSLGHDVQVLTGFPNYPSGQLYPEYTLKLRQQETLDNIDVMRVWLYPNHSQSGTKRVANYLSFAISTAILGLFLRRRPDIIFVYHPPLSVAVPARWLSFIWQRPFIYQVQDLWPETLKATGMIHHGSILRLVGWVAQWVYRAAAKILVVSKGFKHNLIEKGVPPEKIEFISHWVDPIIYYPAEKNEGLAISLGLSGKFNVMFAGNIGDAQGLETLVATAKLLEDQKDIQFVIIGDGIALPRLQQLVKEKELQNILFLGRYQPQEMSVLYALADVLFLHLKDEPLFQITIPHKIFAYMASGKPILGAVTGDAAELILTAKAGDVCPPGDAAILAERVQEMANMDTKKLAQMGQNGRSSILANYSKTHLVKEIETVLQSIVSKRE